MGNRSRGKAVIGLFVLALVAAFAWSVGQDDAVPPDVVEPALQVPTSPVVAEPLPDVSSELRVELPALDSRTRVEVAEAPATVQKSPVEIPEKRLHGTVALNDPDGLPLPAPSGTFTLVAWKEHQGSRIEVDVTRGEWSAPLEKLADCVSVSVQDVLLGGEWAILDSPTEHVPLPEDLLLEIVAHLKPSTHLHVLDRSTGADLSGVRLVKTRGWPPSDLHHPGLDFEQRILHDPLQSPIALSDLLSTGLRKNKQTLQVGAEGFCWAPVELSFDRGGDFTVRLEAGGDLKVQLEGYDPASKAVLRLQAIDESEVIVRGRGRPEVEVEIGTRHAFNFIGMRPGNYWATIDIGNWWGDHEQLGAASVQVEAGGLAYVAIECKSAPVVERAPMAGVVLIPREWGESGVMVVAELMDIALGGFDYHQMVFTGMASKIAKQAGYSSLPFRFSNMQVGSYELGVLEPAFSIVIDLPPGGREDFVLQLPPPVEFRLTLLDRASGAIVKTDSAMWGPKRPEGVDGGRVVILTADPDTGVYTFQAPAMEIQFMIQDWDYMALSETLDLSSGVTEHTILLDPATLIEVRLFDGETLVPLGQSLRLGLEQGHRISWEPAPETTGWVGMRTQDDSHWRAQVTEAGLYRVTIPSIDGFLQTPVQVIEAFAGQTTKHKVMLQREP